MEWTELGREPVQSPEAIGRRPGGGKWSAHVQRWWRTWARSPMASQFLETDWNHLRHVALLLESYIAEPSAAKWSAIQSAEERLGSTIAARLQLRLRPHTRGPEAKPERDEPQLRSVSPQQDPRLELVKKASGG